MYRVDGSIKSEPYKQKPSFEEMYKEISCSMIEMSTACLPKYSNRKDGYTDLWMDEESKLKHPFIINKGIIEIIKMNY